MLDLDAIEVKYGPCTKATHGHCRGDHDPNVLDAIAELRKLREETRWTPVEERLPEKTDFYLAVINGVVVKSDYDTELRKFLPPTWDSFITHWRLLPKPPEVG